jgi:hypothetical protein
LPGRSFDLHEIFLSLTTFPSSVKSEQMKLLVANLDSCGNFEAGAEGDIKGVIAK